MMLSLGITSTKGNMSHHQVLTTCKICGLGVYKGQAWVWCRDPMGMVHTACQSKDSLSGA